MNSLSGIWRQDYIGSSKAYGMSMKHYSISSGPDNPGTWSDSKTNLTLSVSTCSSSNLRLMHSPCNRYTLAYSGDIYNHLALRRELSTEGRVIDWHGASDTETLLVSLCHWGVVRCTKKLNGPFIFALWDASEQALFIARDHMGNKPIYYGYSGEAFVFGSEIRALVSNPSWKNEIDRNALALYLRYQNIPAPYSIYKNIKKLPPAHFVVINNEGKSISDPKCYWEIDRKSTRLNSSHVAISYAVFCLKKKKHKT